MVIRKNFEVFFQNVQYFASSPSSPALGCYWSFRNRPVKSRSGSGSGLILTVFGSSLSGQTGSGSMTFSGRDPDLDSGKNGSGSRHPCHENCPSTSWCLFHFLTVVRQKHQIRPYPDPKPRSKGVIVNFCSDM